MTDDRPTERLLAISRRYVDWLAPRATAVLVVSLLLTVAGGGLASRLQVRGSFADLLPPDRPSVKALDEVQARIEVLGSLYVAVEHAEESKRKEAIAFVTQALRELEGGLIGAVESDPLPTASYLWNNRFLFVSTEDLQKALDRLPEYIEERRKKANPLLLDFEEEPSNEEQDERDRLERMKERLERAEYRYESAKNGYVSEDGAFQVVVVRTSFESSKTSKGRRLVRTVREIVKRAEAKFPGARFGITGDVITTMQEQESIIRGMATAAGITVLLVMLSLVLYFRALRAVWWILAGLTVGSVVTFGAAELIIGHLNVASAFLAAIVVGNGINPNIILIARYREEHGDGVSDHDAVARAIAGAFRGTIAASLTAGVAYASLIATEFRGFRDFGIIGSLGMALCWVAAFTVVPAIILRFGGKGETSWSEGESWGVALARLLPQRRYGWVLAAGALLSVLSILQTYRFVSGDPLEEDWRKLRSSSSDLQETRYWNERMKDELVNAPNKYLAGRFLIAADSAEDASEIRKALEPYAGEGAAEDQRLLAYLRGYDDAVPPDQEKKLEILAEIRRTIDEVMGKVPRQDRPMMRKLRPPEALDPIVLEEVPEQLLKAFVETDGRVGRTLVAALDERFDHWNVVQLVDFVERFREIELPRDAVIGGQAFVFADMVASMTRDGPIASGLAMLGSFLAVLLIVGMRWHGVVTLACAGLGTLAMIAIASSLGVKLNFLDFIALPLTIGIGVDYAANIAARDQQDNPANPRHLLATTGGAVFLCSLTTTIGYGSLLLSDNAGIRSFGLAAIIGEVACGVIALIGAPVLFAWLRRAGRLPSRAPGREASAPSRETA